MKFLALSHFSWDTYTQTELSLTATNEPLHGPGLVCGGRYFLLASCCPKYCSSCDARRVASLQLTSEYPIERISSTYTSITAAILLSHILHNLGCEGLYFRDPGKFCDILFHLNGFFILHLSPNMTSMDHPNNLHAMYGEGRKPMKIRFHLFHSVLPVFNTSVKSTPLYWRISLHIK